MKQRTKGFLVFFLVAVWVMLLAGTALAGPPNPPADVHVISMTSTSATLGWTEGLGATAYQVRRLDPGGTEYTPLPIQPAGTTSYTDAGLTPGATYRYYVYSSNLDGETPSAGPLEVTLPAAGAPAAPVNLEAVSITTSSVTLKWTDRAGDEIRYYVERRLSADSLWAEIYHGAANLESYEDTSVTPGTTYVYRIYCTNATGYSDNSNEVTVTIPDIGTPPSVSLATPDSLHVVAVTSAQVDIAWNDNAAGETAYYVLRGIYNPVGSYTDVLIATLGADANAYSDTTVVPGTTYDYTVYCSDGINSSPVSNNILVDVPASTTTPPTGTPAAPTNLLVTGISTSGVDLIWTDNSSDETGFMVERRGPGDADFVFYDSLPPDTDIYADTGFGVPFQPGEIYYYRVEAINAAGHSAFSNTASALIPSGGTSILSFFIDSNIYYVNGTATTMDVAVMATENRTLLPIRYVVEPLGGAAIWDGTEQKATVYLNHHVVELWVGNNTARVDGINTMIDPSNPNVMPLAIPPGRIMMPLRFIAESTGCTVDWFPDTGEARVTFTPSI